MNELLDALILSLEQILRQYAPNGILAARRAIQNVGDPTKRDDIVADLMTLEYLRNALLIAAETTRALMDEISRVTLDNITDLSGELPVEEV